LKIKKRALRNRFRQPILRLLTSFKSLEIRTTTQNINEQQWKWTSGEKSTASTVSAVAIKKEQPKVVPQVYRNRFRFDWCIFFLDMLFLIYIETIGWLKS
jgi:hypothetical protein